MQSPPRAEPWCRALPLEQVASILEQSAPAFGVARAGSITRLDSIGIATATAVRSNPMGESVSVSTGKGDSELHARVGALAEALERYCAEPRGRVAVRTARVNELDGPVVLPDALILPEALHGGELIDWCAGHALNGERVWVPANSVFFPYYPSDGAARLCAANTTGLAVGATLEEALVFAVLEAIERDAYSRAIALATVGRGGEIPVVDIDSVRESAGAELDAIQSRGHDILVRDLRCDTDVPCYLCTISDGVLAHSGTAARPGAAEAVRAALQEASQSRLTDLQGAREDMPSRDDGGAVDPWFLNAGNAAVVPVRDGWDAESAAGVLEQLCFRLRALEPRALQPELRLEHAARRDRLSGSAEALIWVDLSLPTVGLAVVRAVTPGLEVWALDPSRVGRRAREWLCLPQ